MSPRVSPGGVPWGFVALLLLSAVFYVGLVGNLVAEDTTDLAGRGLAVAVAAACGMALWACLVGLYVLAWANGRLPRAVAVGALALLPLSAIAAAVAAAWAGEAGHWLLAAPVLAPPLLALLALWARLPAVHRALPAGPVCTGLGLAIVVLTAVPLVVGWIESEGDPQREAARVEFARRLEADNERRSRAAEEEEAARFASLGPDSPLADYVNYLYGDEARRTAALAGIRQVRSRNGDAATLLEAGRLNDLELLWRFDLDPAAICTAYAAALRRQAGRIARGEPGWVVSALEVERQLDNTRWLVASGCDLEGVLVLLEERIRAIADNVRLTGLADGVAAARKSR